MSPEFIAKWESLLDGVDKHQIPVEFIKKFILRLRGRKQQTINVQKLLNQGLDPEEIEDVITEKLVALDESVTGIEIILNVQSIAETVQPETDILLRGI
jgi:hypothetical protein